MRVWLCVLSACAGTSVTTPPTEEPPGESAAVSVIAEDVRCPRRPLVVEEMPLDDAPTLERELWLDFAISTADVVVEGTIDSELRGETLCGEASASFALHPLHDEDEVAGHGVWMAVRTPRGYLILNPRSEPVARAEWDALVARAEPREAPSPQEHASGNQIYRTIEVDGRAVWHGVEISQIGGDVHVVLHERGESVARMAFDAHGLERVIFNPLRGRGFMLQNARGALWRFEHYVDRELEGTSRTYTRGTAQLVRETHHRRGRMHGRARTWDEGRVASDVTYERGLIAPVVTPPGDPGEAQIHYGPDGDVSYSAPDDVMNAIRVGMRASEVARLLGLPISPAMGVRFPGYRCEEALTIRFRGQRVSDREILPNGAHCM